MFESLILQRSVWDIPKTGKLVSSNWQQSQPQAAGYVNNDPYTMMDVVENRKKGFLVSIEKSDFAL